MKKIKAKKFNPEEFGKIAKELNLTPLSEKQRERNYCWAMWKKHGDLARWFQKVRLKLPF